MNARKPFEVLALAAALAVAAVAGPAAAREPEILPTVGDSFAAPYDAVWDATLRGLGVLRPVVADKTSGRIETEPFPFNFVIGRAPAPARGPVRLASADPAAGPLADSGSGGARPTQVIWVALHITVSRAGENRTVVQVQPPIHDSLLTGYTPGPTNNPWSDLFARVHGYLGGR
jgi:hypothetical protein